MCSRTQTKLVWLQNNISQNKIYQWIISNFSKTNNPRIKRNFFLCSRQFLQVGEIFEGNYWTNIFFQSNFDWNIFFWHYFPIFYLKILKKIVGKDGMQKSFKLSSLLVKDGLKTNTLFLLLIPLHFKFFLQKWIEGDILYANYYK
jgi:hypothetical protein